MIATKQSKMGKKNGKSQFVTRCLRSIILVVLSVVVADLAVVDVRMATSRLDVRAHLMKPAAAIGLAARAEVQPLEALVEHEEDARARRRQRVDAPVGHVARVAEREQVHMSGERRDAARRVVARRPQALRRQAALLAEQSEQAESVQKRLRVPKHKVRAPLASGLPRRRRSLAGKRLLHVGQESSPEHARAEDRDGKRRPALEVLLQVRAELQYVQRVVPQQCAPGRLVEQMANGRVGERAAHVVQVMRHVGGTQEI